MRYVGSHHLIRPADEGCVKVAYRDFPAEIEVAPMARRSVGAAIDLAKVAKARADVDAIAAACGW